MKTFSFTLSVLTLMLWVFFSDSYAQVTQQWVARYEGPGNSSDQANAVVLDGSGNVYVTGFSVGSGTGSDFATIKYNSTGVQQWVARYNGLGNSNDFATSIVRDNLGNLYVTGRSPGSGTGDDFATIKYNSSGVQQWVSRYNGAGNGSDKASSLAVDGSGNVYVTGRSAGIGTADDYVTIKYNSSGVQQWVQTYDGPGNNDDYANSLGLDGSGNVYVTGGSRGSGSTDYATIKYNSSGVQQWVQRYNGLGNGPDEAHSMVLDALDNVYVTGGSFGIGTFSNYLTIKYNSSGVQQWTSTYNGLANALDVSYSIAVDGSDNVYVTGKSGVTGQSFNYATIKLNSSGSILWIRSYNGPGNNGNSDDIAHSLVLDDSNNVYVTGYSTGITSWGDYVTIKYNSTGVQQWLRIYNGTGNGFDEALSIAVDGSGNVYVTGSSDASPTNFDFATIKYINLLPPSPPVLYSPPNNSQGWGLTTLLVWNRSPNAVSYHVWVATDSLFVNMILNDSTITDSTRTISGLQNNTNYWWCVSAKNAAGTSQWTERWKFRTGLVGIQPVSNEIPNEFKLYDNYPNPFNPTTNIRYSIPKSGMVKIVVYDVIGREVQTLVNKSLKPGTYEATFNASQFTSGIYFYKLTAGDFVETKKMLMIK